MMFRNLKENNILFILCRWALRCLLLLFLTLGFGGMESLESEILSSSYCYLTPHFFLSSPSSLAQTFERGERVEKRNRDPSSKSRSLRSHSRENRRKLQKSPASKQRIVQKADATEEDDLLLSGFKIFVGMILTLFLYYQLKGRKPEPPAQAEPPKPAGRYLPAKPLALNTNQDVDPATQDQSRLIKVLTKREEWKSKISSKISSLPRSLPKMSLFKGDSAHGERLDPFTESETLFGKDDTGQKNALEEEISALAAGSEDIDPLPHPLKAAGGQHREKKPFPEHVARHFEIQNQEKLLWHQTYYQGSNEGLVAITNQRILHVYQEQVFRFFPPGMKLKIERNQHPLLGLRTIRRRRTRKDFLLIGAAPFVVWFPYGTIVSLVMLALYAGWTRDELAIGINPKRLKSYPLPPETQAQFLEVLRRAKSRLSRGRKSKTSQHAS